MLKLFYIMSNNNFIKYPCYSDKKICQTSDIRQMLKDLRILHIIKNEYD